MPSKNLLEGVFNGLWPEQERIARWWQSRSNCALVAFVRCLNPVVENATNGNPLASDPK